MSRNLSGLHELHSTCLFQALFDERERVIPGTVPSLFFELSWTLSGCTSFPVNILRTVLLVTRPAGPFVTKSRGIATADISGALHQRDVCSRIAPKLCDKGSCGTCYQQHCSKNVHGKRDAARERPGQPKEQRWHST